MLYVLHVGLLVESLTTTVLLESRTSLTCKIIPKTFGQAEEMRVYISSRTTNWTVKGFKTCRGAVGDVLRPGTRQTATTVYIVTI